MIEYAFFDNVLGQHVDFNDLKLPLKRWTTEVDTRSNDRDKAVQHGIWRGDTYLGKRLLHLEGDVLEDTSASYISRRRTLLRAVLPRTQAATKIAGTFTIRFTGMTEDVTCACSLDGYPDMPMEALSPSVGPYLLNLKAFDPRMYGATLNQSVASIPAAVAGRAYNKTYNKTYSAGSSGGDAVVNNVGEIETYPIVKLFGPLTSPSLTRRADPLYPPSTDLTLTMQDLVLPTSSDYVIVDFAQRTALLNGTVDVYYTISGRWWALEPGNNTIHFTAFSSGGGNNAQIQWRNAYML